MFFEGPCAHINPARQPDITLVPAINTAFVFQSAFIGETICWFCKRKWHKYMYVLVLRYYNLLSLVFSTGGHCYNRF